MSGDVGRRGNEKREEAKGELGRGAAEGKGGKKDGAISTLINTHVDEVGTSPADLSLLTDLSNCTTMLLRPMGLQTSNIVTQHTARTHTVCVQPHAHF